MRRKTKRKNKNKAMLNYKGFTGLVENIDEETGAVFGRVIGIYDSITFTSGSNNSVKQAFHKSVDKYLETIRPSMPNPNLPTELTTELDDETPTYRDLLDPIFALSKDEIRKIAIFLQCVVEGFESPDSLHKFLDAPRANVE